MRESGRKPVGVEQPWAVVKEVGLDYAAQDGLPDSVGLVCPVSVERLSAGRYLIVDDLAAGHMTLRMTCRTLLVSSRAGLLYDSRAAGIDDARGCVTDKDAYALLDRTRRELLMFAPSGERSARLELSSVSPHLPRVFAWTYRKTFVVAFMGGIQKLDLAEIDSRGRVLWRISQDARGGDTAAIGVPGSIQLLSTGALLVADEFHHVVWEVDRAGVPTLRWGKWHTPAARDGCLHHPMCARVAHDGTLLVADTHNHRVLSIAGCRETEIRPDGGEFFDPSSVSREIDGHYLVSDAGNRCVYELDAAGGTVWEHGTRLYRKRHMSFPRSVEYRGDGHYLIADTGHDRVVEVSGSAIQECVLRDTQPLFWPRAARRTVEGTLIIADARNGRVLEVDSGGRIRRSLKDVLLEDHRIPLGDPHDVRLLPCGNVLITDAERNFVVEAAWDGRVRWVIGLNGDLALQDPHSAQMLPDGRVLISDSGNHRLLFVDPATGSAVALSELRSGDAVWRLKAPKYAAQSPDGLLVVADSGNNRVLISNRDSELLREVSHVSGSPISHLQFPRWVDLVSSTEMVVSDHSNHRILHLRRDAA